MRIKLAAEFVIEAESMRDAEKLLNAWIGYSGEDDDRLISYDVYLPDSVSVPVAREP